MVDGCDLPMRIDEKSERCRYNGNRCVLGGSTLGELMLHTAHRDIFRVNSKVVHPAMSIDAFRRCLMKMRTGFSSLKRP